MACESWSPRQHWDCVGTVGSQAGQVGIDDSEPGGSRRTLSLGACSREDVVSLWVLRWVSCPELWFSKSVHWCYFSLHLIWQLSEFPDLVSGEIKTKWTHNLLNHNKLYCSVSFLWFVKQILKMKQVTNKKAVIFFLLLKECVFVIEYWDSETKYR